MRNVFSFLNSTLITHNSKLAARVLAIALGTALSAAAWAAEPPFTASKTVEEEWQVVLINGAHSGFMHTRVEEGRGAGDKPVFRYKMRHEMSVARMGMEISVETTLALHESPARGTEWFSLSSKMGAVEAVRYEGVREGDVLRVRGSAAGQSYDNETPWPEGTLSLYEASRRTSEALRAGKQTFSLRMFEPQAQRPATVTYTVEGEEETALLGERRKLRKIRMEQDIMPGILTFAWADAEGKILKTRVSMPLFGEMETVVTTKERAMRPAAPAELLAQTLVSPDKPIARPRDAKRASYRVAFRGGKAPAFPSDARQTAKAAGPGIVALDVVVGQTPSSAMPEKPQAGAPAPLSEMKKYLAPNPYLQSDDAALAAQARKITATLKTDWGKAQALNAWVFRRIEKKSLGVGLATAKEVFENPQGDCTEHAMLLAAMLRAANVPSRVAVGLVYSPEWKAFGYHMWTEAFVGNAWHALDPTFDETLVNPTHIKFADSALEQGLDPAFLAGILSFMQNMEIKVVKVEYE